MKRINKAKWIGLFATILLCTAGFAQQKGLQFIELQEHGLSAKELDSLYKSAVHIDSSKAVFKTGAQQQQMYGAYSKLLQDFGNFLKSKGFEWKQPTRCFNRIYFAPDGTIDYFVFNFTTKGVKTEDQLSERKQKEFQRLLNLFVKDYKIEIQAQQRFAQCSPTVYRPVQ